VSGFWHGANWTFIVWGIYHALLFFPLFLRGKNRKYTDVVAAGKLFPTVKEFFQMLTTFLLAVIGWVIFRANSLTEAGWFLWDMVMKFRVTTNFIGKTAMMYIVVFLLVEWIQRNKEHPLQMDKLWILRFKPVRWLLYITLFWVAYVYGGSQQEFIYFQF
jgi:D-alanyl-lipoteichoic acid acyltransferase DltB (MBOAT superfamily)